jgi:hypothetical protein
VLTVAFQFVFKATVWSVTAQWADAAPTILPIPFRSPRAIALLTFRAPIVRRRRVADVAQTRPASLMGRSRTAGRHRLVFLVRFV